MHALSTVLLTLLGSLQLRGVWAQSSSSSAVSVSVVPIGVQVASDFQTPASNASLPQSVSSIEAS